MKTIQEILDEVNGVFREVLDNDAITVLENTTADDVDEWDSLSHIQLVVSVEKHFRIRFTSSEINNFKNVGEMCQCIQSKLAQHRD
jgi:acyl carrier protein